MRHEEFRTRSIPDPREAVVLASGALGKGGCRGSDLRPGRKESRHADRPEADAGSEIRAAGSGPAGRPARRSGRTGTGIRKRKSRPGGRLGRGNVRGVQPWRALYFFWVLLIT